MAVATGEILFVKCVKDGIPNRDPLNDSDARRIFGEEDGRISLSDVSIKRDVRDYVMAKYPDGGPEKRYFVWCREERAPDGKLYDRKKLADLILERAGRDKEVNKEKALLDSAFDMRVFGAVFSVKEQNFHRTGPVQFGWAHSLHPVETKYVQGTVVMPSDDEAGQGSIWTTYILPFAVFAMPGVINATIAMENNMTDDDVELLLEGLWKGTLHRQARGRGLQQPLLLVHVEYNDPFFRIGYLEDYIALEPEKERWLGSTPPTQLSEVALDVQKLARVLGPESPFANKIKRVRWWKNPELTLKGELPGTENKVW
ncbi:CRISPR-associated protein, Csh2 family [Thermanaeromonas toyohensis ToBE]|uniref:CRISPR-associated protein, Csh2 family n=1 Tax=Thermanaeromonas toyohensis ToBE TaxID=698762 RepID=A0A1W1VZW4_9FIRM|nr:type I CRISPR-associated protein Cas7 [Thermanaeromonas toyohensis]SMB98800.1 CRISPR-associated protein, Csh2 family [Thermanaeromonas toyohensis ToBE]